MPARSTRRNFLKLLAAAACSGYLLDATAAGSHAASKKYSLSNWTGDEFGDGHLMRDGKVPKIPTTAEKKVDFVIVGGGLAGLASAHYLADHDYLLLEQYDDLGGHCRGGSHNGIDYSWASAYFANDKGELGKLVAELGLKPVALPEAKNAWYWNETWLRGCQDKSGGTGGADLFASFAKLRNDFKSFWGEWDGLYSQKLLDTPELMKMDDVALGSCLSGYDPGFLAMLDSFLRSSLCENVARTSLLSGLSSLEDIFEPTFVLEGGNPAIAGALARRLSQSHPNACQTSTFVWSIQQKADGASVAYSTRDGAMHRVDCKHVIVAIPHLVAARVMQNLSDKAKATMFRFRYGSYLVANVLMNKKLFDGEFDNFLAAPFSIADITRAEIPYVMSGHYKEQMGSVLTVYRPYEPGSEGRTVLLQGDRKKLARSVMSDLEKIVPNLQGSVEKVVLSRWGHALAVTRPKYFSYLAELHKLETESFSLAHSSAHGLPGAESAVAGAIWASRRATGQKPPTAKIYSIDSSDPTSFIHAGVH